MGTYRIEVLWDCSFCSTKEIGGSKQKCPNCGRQRGEDVAFYLPKNFGVENAVEDESVIEDDPDWLCSFCGDYNSAKLTRCSGCGGRKERGNRNYFDVTGR